MNKFFVIRYRSSPVGYPEVVTDFVSEAQAGMNARELARENPQDQYFKAEVVLKYNATVEVTAEPVTEVKITEAFYDFSY